MTTQRGVYSSVYSQYTRVYVFPIGEYTYTHTPEYTPTQYTPTQQT